MDNVARSGRTILFVSHNMTAVQQLCHRGIFLKDGQISYIGDIQNAVHHYLRDIRTYQGVDLGDRVDRKGKDWFRFTRVAIYDTSGNELQHILSGQDIRIRLYYESSKRFKDASVLVSFNVRNSKGYLLTNLNSTDVGKEHMDIYSSGYFECYWPRFNLRSGTFDCTIYCRINGIIVDWLQDAFNLQVEDGDFHNTGRIISRDQGDVLMPYDWTSSEFD
jgi:lipopolysaccharide transport system ATP-binding protein